MYENAGMCEKNIYVPTNACMCSETCIRMCMDTYFHQLHCLIFAFRLHAQPAVRSAHQHLCVAIGVLLRPACSAYWWLTNGKAHAREKEVACVSCMRLPIKLLKQQQALQAWLSDEATQAEDLLLEGAKRHDGDCMPDACTYTYAAVKGDARTHT